MPRKFYLKHRHLRKIANPSKNCKGKAVKLATIVYIAIYVLTDTKRGREDAVNETGSSGN